MSCTSAAGAGDCLSHHYHSEKFLVFEVHPKPSAGSQNQADSLWTCTKVNRGSNAAYIVYSDARTYIPEILLHLGMMVRGSPGFLTVQKAMVKDQGLLSQAFGLEHGCHHLELRALPFFSQNTTESCSGHNLSKTHQAPGLPKVISDPRSSPPQTPGQAQWCTLESSIRSLICHSQTYILACFNAACLGPVNMSQFLKTKSSSQELQLGITLAKVVQEPGSQSTASLGILAGS